MGNLKSLANDLIKKMVEITGGPLKKDNIRIGMGSFVDKTMMPFVSTTEEKMKNPCDAKSPCEPPYTYRNNMALDSNTTRFEEVINSTKSSSNLDAPEAGLDAMMQGKPNPKFCKILFASCHKRSDLINGRG